MVDNNTVNVRLDCHEFLSVEIEVNSSCASHGLRLFLSYQRGNMGSVVRYCESSMRNGFGLKYIYQFLNIPFLQLQRESLLQQLQINARDMDGSLEEIDSYARSEENNYDLFSETLANKRRNKQEALAGDVVAKAKPLEEAKRLHDEAVQAAAFVEQQQHQLQQQNPVASLNHFVQVIKKTTEPPSAMIKPTLTTKQKPPVVAVQPIVQQGEHNRFDLRCAKNFRHMSISAY
jgi:hypothetical protein